MTPNKVRQLFNTVFVVYSVQKKMLPPEGSKYDIQNKMAVNAKQNYIIYTPIC